MRDGPPYVFWFERYIEKKAIFSPFGVQTVQKEWLAVFELHMSEPSDTTGGSWSPIFWGKLAPIG